jgi:predicted dehydrogenase
VKKYALDFLSVFPTRRPVPTGEHARHVVEVIEKAYKSAETGEVQTLETTIDAPPKTHPDCATTN